MQPAQHLTAPTGVEDMTWYAADYIYYMLAFLIFSEVSIFVMKKYITNFSKFSLRIQRNMAVYILESIVTFIVFLIVVARCMPLISGKGTIEEVIFGRTSVALLIALYVFELVYRPNMNWQLTLHHLFTIVICTVGVESTMESENPKFMAAGLALSFTATTEQLCFISLFMFRLKHKYAGPLMRIAAIQSLTFKLCSVVGTYIILVEAVWTDKNRNSFPAQGWFVTYRIILFTIVPGLVFTQVYGAYVLWKISHRVSIPQPIGYEKGTTTATITETTPEGGNELQFRRDDEPPSAAA